jgi:hypothetical protein
MEVTKMARLSLVAVALAALASTTLLAETIRIVEEGRPRATVVVPRGSDEQTRLAAELLAESVG